ncbi:antitoxin VbhA family protein [Leucobacter sp. Z1108]
MEGLHTTEATKADAGKYVAGEIDLADFEDRIRARYGIVTKH